MNQTIIFILLAILGVIVFIILNKRRSKTKKEWLNDSVYDRLKMIEDGWSVDDVLTEKYEDENIEDTPTRYLQ